MYTIRTSIIWKCPKDTFIKFYNESNSYVGLLRKFGLDNKGGNHKTLKKRLKEEGLSEDRLRTFVNRPKNRIENELMFTTDSVVHRHAVKKRIIREKLIEYKCKNCGLEPFWQNKKLVLILDHINGINNDHRIENLRFLCPNCNSQTSTFAGKNQFHNKKRNFCECGKHIAIVSKNCKKCYNKYHRIGIREKIKWPTKEELEQILKITPCSVLAKKLGVSDNAIGRRCKILGIKKHPRGYWMKLKHNSLRVSETENHSAFIPPEILGSTPKPAIRL